jgi:imidazolonepropionase-like amidohydrolase
MQESCTAVFGTPIPVPSPELQAAVVTAAHKHGLVAVAHALSQRETILALEAGVDGLAHCFCDEVPSEELVEAYKKNDSFLIPTLVLAASMTGEENEHSKEHESHDLSGKLLSEESKSCFCRKAMMAGKDCKVEYSYQTVKLLKENGVDIVA